MRDALRLARLPALLTAGALGPLVFLTGRRELILHLYLLGLAAVALFHLVAGVRAAYPPAGGSRFDAALRRRTPRAERLPELARIEREVALGLTTAFDLHFRLRPSLRGIATELLVSRRGIDLDVQTDAARRALGEETWELVRPDREAPADRFGPGLRLERLGAVVASLERL